MFSPVSWASCSRICLVGFGVATNAAFNVSSCLALMVVRGPRRFPPRFWSSFSLLTVSLSDRAAISVSFRTTSSCSWSWESGDKLGSLHAVTAGITQEHQDNQSQTMEVLQWETEVGKNKIHPIPQNYIYHWGLSAVMWWASCDLPSVMQTTTNIN